MFKLAFHSYFRIKWPRQPLPQTDPESDDKSYKLMLRRVCICFFPILRRSSNLTGYLARLRISWLYLLQRDKTPTKEGSGNHASDNEAPVLDIWGVWNTTSLPLLPASLWFRKIVTVKVSSMGQIFDGTVEKTIKQRKKLLKNNYTKNVNLDVR